MSKATLKRATKPSNEDCKKEMEKVCRDAGSRASESGFIRRCVFEYAGQWFEITNDEYCTKRVCGARKRQVTTAGVKRYIEVVNANFMVGCPPVRKLRRVSYSL